MKLIFYQGEIRNFGDELNSYIWPRIFPEILDTAKHNKCSFYGIGTIIDKRIDPEEKAIIFGSGVRDISFNYRIKNWDIFFLRGPISSKILGFPKFITDPAYCLHFLPEHIHNQLNNKNKEINNIGVIPHFLSIKLVDWDSICKELGFLFINPTESPENIIKKISTCNYIHTEAMHGAIIADYFRIPWTRFRFYSHIYESDMVSELKWNDWLSSMNINNSHYEIPYLNVLNKKGVKGLIKLSFQRIFIKNVLSRANTYSLSSDQILILKYEQFEEQISNFKSKYLK